MESNLLIRETIQKGEDGRRGAPLPRPFGPPLRVFMPDRWGKGPPCEQGSPSKSACGNGSTTSDTLNGGGYPPAGVSYLADS